MNSVQSLNNKLFFLSILEVGFLVGDGRNRLITYSSCNCGQSRYLFSCRPLLAHSQLLPQESRPYL